MLRPIAAVLVLLSCALARQSDVHYTTPEELRARLKSDADVQIVISTWGFSADATDTAATHLFAGSSPIDALTHGLKVCEDQQCDGTVGFGGSPDEKGETRLDALLMDGATMNVGAVASLRRVKNAVGVARAVLDHTQHTMLVGESATEFAIEMGFAEETLSTNASLTRWEQWRRNNCQPNFRENVVPDPSQSCGPYRPDTDSKQVPESDSERERWEIRVGSHDTIGMVAITADTPDSQAFAAGTSTNGAAFKVPGRVGDSPIVGSGAYASDVGGCAGTGDGDIMMRFSPCYQAVTSMEYGMSPQEAANDAIARIARKFPNFSGAIVVLGNVDGVDFGVACANMPSGVFEATLKTNALDQVVVIPAPCIDTATA